LQELKGEPERPDFRDPIQLGFLDPDDCIGLERATDLFTQKFADRSASRIHASKDLVHNPTSGNGMIFPLVLGTLSKFQRMALDDLPHSILFDVVSEQIFGVERRIEGGHSPFVAHQIGDSERRFAI
jgi:hypothetical protein